MSKCIYTAGWGHSSAKINGLHRKYVRRLKFAYFSSTIEDGASVCSRCPVRLPTFRKDHDRAALQKRLEELRAREKALLDVRLMLATQLDSLQVCW